MGEREREPRRGLYFFHLLFCWSPFIGEPVGTRSFFYDDVPAAKNIHVLIFFFLCFLFVPGDGDWRRDVPTSSWYLTQSSCACRQQLKTLSLPVPRPLDPLFLQWTNKCQANRWPAPRQADQVFQCPIGFRLEKEKLLETRVTMKRLLSLEMVNRILSFSLTPSFSKKKDR